MMEFKKYRSAYHCRNWLPKHVGLGERSMMPQEFYPRLLTILGADTKFQNTQGKELTAARMFTEEQWHRAGMPYYKVWPAFCDIMSKIRLNVPLCNLQLKTRSVAVRFPCQSQLLKPLLISAISKNEKGKLIINDGNVACWLIVNASVDEEQRSKQITSVVPLDSDKSFDELLIEAVHAHVGGEKVDTQNVRQNVAIATNILLLANDPSIIVPDVLSSDARHYERTGDEKYVRKAHRRGKIGWNVGKELEVIPHLRRPHYGLRHTGKDRKVPRIVPIKGCVVHRQKVVAVPTGYMTPGGIEIEEPA